MTGDTNPPQFLLSATTADSNPSSGPVRNAFYLPAKLPRPNNTPGNRFFMKQTHCLTGGCHGKKHNCCSSGLTSILCQPYIANRSNLASRKEGFYRALYRNLNHNLHNLEKSLTGDIKLDRRISGRHAMRTIEP